LSEIEVSKVGSITKHTCFNVAQVDDNSLRR